MVNNQYKTAAKTNTSLSKFDIKVNEFGEIITNFNIDNINDFLNKNVIDKKLINREER